MKKKRLWRLIYFRTNKTFFGDRGMYGGNYAVLYANTRGRQVRPPYSVTFRSQEAAQQAADMINRREGIKYMVWPIAVDGKFPWNPIGTE